MLETYLSARRALVEEQLKRVAPEGIPETLKRACEYSLLAGGKRLRPVMTLAACEAVGGKTDDALAPALALEMIHTYSLIHDDLPAMDDDTLRRGRPTAHVVYGEGIAILAGDGLHAEAFTLLAREPRTDEPSLVLRKIGCVQVVGEAAGPAGMVGGQAIDLHAAGQVPGSPVTLDADGLRAIGPIATTLATLEGLDAHARAVTQRLAVIEAQSSGGRR